MLSVITRAWFVALSISPLSTAACFGGNDPTDREAQLDVSDGSTPEAVTSQDGDASENIAPTSQALSSATEDCSGTTLISFIDFYEIPCSYLGYFDCPRGLGCYYDAQTGLCLGFPGLLIPYENIQRVSCANIPTDQCLSYPGCSLVPRCQPRCEGNTLVSCVSNQEQRSLCDLGCNDDTGSPYCIYPPREAVPCDVSCEPGYFLCGDLWTCSVFCYSPDWTPDPACPAR